MSERELSNRPPGREIAGCELIREIGSGNSGTVYLGKQKRTERLVACKLFHLESDEDKLLVENLFADVIKAVKLDHPNVVKTVSAGTSREGEKYLITEFVDGASLEEIRTGRPELISGKFLLNMATKLAGAMDYAWNKFQITHGDLKPGNILVRTLDGEIKVADLGLIRHGASDDAMVTPLYAAPEVIRQENQTADPRSDIYSFGILLYELCCGTAPFQGSLEEIISGHLTQQPEPLIRKNPEMDPEMADFIDLMIAKSPADRPANWQEVRNVFSGIRTRLYPPAKAVLDITGEPTGNEKSSSQTSWQAKLGKQPGIFAKYPLILPILLLLLIAGAVAAILLQLL